MRHGKLIAVVCTAVIVLSCQSEDSTGPSAKQPASIVGASGNNQTSRVGEALPSPLVVRVNDAAGEPLPSVTVSWAVSSGAASLSATSTATDANGEASVTVTVGTSVGAVTITASVGGLNPVTFTAGVLAGPAATMAKFSGDSQSAQVNTETAVPLVVRIADAFGNGVPSVSVAWSVAGGGGSLSQATSVTDADGLASTTLTLGTTAGANTVEAAVPGLTGSPVTFSATGTPGAAGQMEIVSGDNQLGVPGNPLADSLVVRVMDVYGNRVEGAAVAFDVIRGAGTANPVTDSTDSAGLARTSYTIPSDPRPAQQVFVAAGGATDTIMAEVVDDSSINAAFAEPVEGDGTPSYPFSTIQPGVDAAQSGDTVWVAAGTYADTVTVVKGVTLSGSPGATVSPPQGVFDAITVSTTERVLIRGLTIDTESEGITASNVFDLRVENSTFLNASVAIRAQNDSTVTGARARLEVCCSTFDGGTPVTMTSSIFANRDVDSFIGVSGGITVRRTTFSCIQIQSGRANAIVSNSDLDECGVWGGIRGIFLDKDSYLEITNNTIRNSTGSDSNFGIYFGGPQQPDSATGFITANSIVDYVQPSATNASAAAVYLDNNAMPVVQFNDIAGNAFAGLRATTTVVIDATCNWWGAPDGPSGNGSGSGDAVIGPVTFVPFATAPVKDTQICN